MSSWVLLALAQTATSPAAAPLVTAEQAMRIYRETFQPVVQPRCPEPSYSGELVVCAPKSEALPLPIEPTPGERVRMVPGEAPRGSVPGCVFACHTGFSVTINMDDARKAVSALKRVLGGKD